MASETLNERSRRTGRRALFLAVPIALLSIAPLVWALISSLRPGEDIFRFLYPISWETFIPSRITFDNFTTVLTGPFGMALWNSVFVTAVSVVVGLALASLAAFALACMDFPGRSFIFAFLVICFLVPFEAIAIPLSTTFRDLGLANTYTGLILPALGNGLAIFLLRQFFMGVPSSLAEAARMDGLGWFGIFWRIYLPLSKGPMIGAGLILFVFQWQSFLWPLLIAPAPDVRLAPVAIADFAQETGVNYGQMFAAAILTAAIPLLLVLFFQRHFSGSNANSGSKE
ncbi:carbohydrate ABC transporter permease [Nesterenkonia muleiensis]|uniref:carbohydrate ABC transporter permease n=1 Tax=Nesterenkonia muleiensis TaxID=2282648 RepID=UPI000E751402|nr:carbohydrate ABC transporter permease [Nesterenkonia muleiensis]